MRPVHRPVMLGSTHVFLGFARIGTRVVVIAIPVLTLFSTRRERLCQRAVFIGRVGFGCFRGGKRSSPAAV